MIEEKRNINVKDTAVWFFKTLILALVCVVLVSLVKYKGGDVNYYNSDATWHSLLTIQAYSETPKSQHLFLPIATLGDADDKGIPWGAAIPDEAGNYYYTSFSPASYFAGWLFLKIFHLPVAEHSLYIFNTLLFILSAAIWGWLISLVFDKSKYRKILVALAVLTYVFSPELLHGLGIVYWAQSLMQVTLLMQISAFYVYKKYNSKAAMIIFYIMAFVNPYIEWTGYVANVGFALAEFCLYWKENKKKGFLKACILGALTVCSLAVFCAHYLLRVDPQTFFKVSLYRFTARSASAAEPMVKVFCGYLESYLWLWVLLLVLIVWNLIENKKIEIKHGVFIALLAFPLLENLLMKQHAILYSFDRMKFVFLLSFLICELASQILEQSGRRKVLLEAGLLVAALGFGVLNLRSYVKDEKRIWEIDYVADNERISEYINENYRDSVLALNGYPVRGYLNLLFGRGIYEYTNVDAAWEKAAVSGKRYVVMLNLQGDAEGQVFDLKGAKIYDTQTNSAKLLRVKNGKVSLKDVAGRN